MLNFKFFVVLAALAITSCNPRSFNQSISDLRASPEPKQEEGIYAFPTDFELASNPLEREALLAELVVDPEVSAAAKKLNLSMEKMKKWILQAVTPLNMGRTSLVQKDIVKYGKDAYREFAVSLIRMLLADPNNQLPALDGSKLPADLFNKEETTDIVFALKANAVVQKDKGGTLRDVNLWGDETKLSPELENNIKTGPLASILRIYEVKDATTERGEKVSGRFILYPEFKQVPELLKAWQAEITAANQLSEKEYSAKIADQFLKCVAIHPFPNGNGRSCRLWSVYALGKRNIPHPLLWSGEDLTLAHSVYLERWEKGVELHRALLEKLRTR